MKKQILSLVLLLIIFLVAFKAKDKVDTDVSGFSVKEIDKSVAKITDSLYAGITEVTNGQYLCMMYYLYKDKKADQIKIAQIDTANWRDRLAYNEPLVELYLRHPAYRDYPLVNVSYEAATLYCEWLTAKYNADPKRHFKKVLFRLPTEKEWEKAACGGDTLSCYPWGPRLRQNGNYMCNFRPYGDEFIRFDALSKKLYVDSLCRCGMSFLFADVADITAPVYTYWPNKFGLYNVCGNVAEMVKEKGLDCGGGWRSTGGDVTVKSRAHYSKSASDLGFRYFMEIKEK
jgi:formylglycine-generating enzyme required for sulfatase activity